MLFEVKTQRWTELLGRIGSHTLRGVGWEEFSSQGDYVHFWGSLAPGQSGIYRIRISDHKLEQLVDLKGFHQASGAGDSGWVGLAPDDSPLVLRDTGTQEIYALDVDFP